MPGRDLVACDQTDSGNTIHSGMTEGAVYECPCCDKVYFSMQAYSMHVTQEHPDEEGLFTCKCCGCFFRYSILSEHIRKYSGKKPLTCSICGKPFANLSAFNNQTDSTSEPHMCDLCKKILVIVHYSVKHEEYCG